jgi:hypothetical protein
MAYMKQLNKTAYNFSVSLILIPFLLHAIYGMQLSYSSKFRIVVSVPVTWQIRKIATNTELFRRAF